MPASSPLVATPAAHSAVTVARANLFMTAPPQDVLAEEVVRRGAHVRSERIGVGTVARRIGMRVLHAVDDPRLENVTPGAVVVRRNGVRIRALEADDATRAREVVVVHACVTAAGLRRLVEVVFVPRRRLPRDAAVHRAVVGEVVRTEPGRDQTPGHGHVVQRVGGAVLDEHRYDAGARAHRLVGQCTGLVTAGRIRAAGDRCDAGVDVRVGRAQDDGHVRTGRDTLDVDAAGIDALRARDFTGSAGDNGRLARAAALVLWQEPVPATDPIAVGKRSTRTSRDVLLRVGDDETALRGDAVEVTRVSGLRGGLVASVQINDERTRRPSFSGWQVEPVVAVAIRGGEGVLGERPGVGRGSG